MEKLLALLTTQEVITRASEKDADLKAIASEITANIAASAQNNSEFMAKIRKEQHGRALVEITKQVTKSYGLTNKQLEDAGIPTDDYQKIMEFGRELTATTAQEAKVTSTNEEHTKALQKYQDIIREAKDKEKQMLELIEQTKAVSSKEISTYKTQTALAQALSKVKTNLSTTVAQDLMNVRLGKYKIEFDAQNNPILKTSEGTDVYNDKNQRIATIEELISWELRDAIPVVNQTGNEGKTLTYTPVDKTKMSAEQLEFQKKIEANFSAGELVGLA